MSHFHKSGGIVTVCPDLEVTIVSKGSSVQLVCVIMEAPVYCLLGVNTCVSVWRASKVKTAREQGNIRVTSNLVFMENANDMAGPTTPVSAMQATVGQTVQN